MHRHVTHRVSVAQAYTVCEPQPVDQIRSGSRHACTIFCVHGMHPASGFPPVLNSQLHDHIPCIC